MTPEQFVAHLGEHRATAILRCDHQDTARRAMEAAVRGGFRIVEFTLTVPGVYELIEEFAAKDLVVGAGTVMTSAQAEKAVQAGASFLVSPVMDETVISTARDLGVAMMPGTHTPTEMWQARQAGAEFCKLFPQAAGGAHAVRSILGPMPFLRIVPTNGVTAQNVGEYLAAGAFAVGCVRAVFPSEALKENNFKEIEERARTLLAAVRAAPRKAPSETPPLPE